MVIKGKKKIFIFYIIGGNLENRRSLFTVPTEIVVDLLNFEFSISYFIVLYDYLNNSSRAVVICEL